MRRQIDENEKLYRELQEQFQNGFLSAADYEAAAQRNRDENARLRRAFENVSQQFILPSIQKVFIKSGLILAIFAT